MTTGENLVVTWNNINETCIAWKAHVRYDAGSFEREVVRHGGHHTIGEVTEDMTATIPTDRRDDFCERVRYWYGGCINLEQSRAIDPRLLDRPEGSKTK